VILSFHAMGKCYVAKLIFISQAAKVNKMSPSHSFQILPTLQGPRSRFASIFHSLNNHAQDLDQKCMHLLMEITSHHVSPSRGAYIFGQDLVLKMQESSALQSLLQYISGLNSEVPIHHSLSLMNLDIVLLEYGHDVSSNTFA